MPLPDSNLAGHKLLHERAVAAINTCQESQDVEFKEAAPFDALRYKIISTALAMGNLRDGGLIVIGVSERDGSWKTTGIAADHLSTFEKTDVVVDQINAFVSPFVDLDLVRLSHEGRDFVILGVRAFRDTPLVCKKNGPDETPLRKGRIFVRPPGKPRTTMVEEAQQMHDLLELAAETRARRILEQAGRIGLAVPASPTDSQRYDEELGGL